MSVAKIETEIVSFESNLPPYDDGSALRLFMRRVNRLFSRGAADRNIRIFICYRRSDASHYAHRIYDALQHRFDLTNVFMDINSIKLGQDFRTTISELISRADVMLVVIGPDWSQPNQYVDLEVEEALRRNILTIPVLVGNATMPREAELAPGICEFAYRHAFSLSDRRWDSDMARLMEEIDESNFGLRTPG